MNFNGELGWPLIFLSVWCLIVFSISWYGLSLLTKKCTENIVFNCLQIMAVASITGFVVFLGSLFCHINCNTLDTRPSNPILSVLLLLILTISTCAGMVYTKIDKCVEDSDKVKTYQTVLLFGVLVLTMPVFFYFAYVVYSKLEESGKEKEERYKMSKIKETQRKAEETKKKTKKTREEAERARKEKETEEEQKKAEKELEKARQELEKEQLALQLQKQAKVKTQPQIKMEDSTSQKEAEDTQPKSEQKQVKMESTDSGSSSGTGTEDKKRQDFIAHKYGVLTALEPQLEGKEKTEVTELLQKLDTYYKQPPQSLKDYTKDLKRIDELLAEHYYKLGENKHSESENGFDSDDEDENRSEHSLSSGPASPPSEPPLLEDWQSVVPAFGSVVHKRQLKS